MFLKGGCVTVRKVCPTDAVSIWNPRQSIIVKTGNGKYKIVDESIQCTIYYGDTEVELEKVLTDEIKKREVKLQSR